MMKHLGNLNEEFLFPSLKTAIRQRVSQRKGPDQMSRLRTSSNKEILCDSV